MEEDMKPPDKRSRYLSYIMLALLTVSIPFLICIVPMLWGHSAYLILTGSMGNEIAAGSVIMTRPALPEDLQEGRIVLFEYKDANILHRIIGVKEPAEPGQERLYLTQGDANVKGEPIPVAASQVEGVYLYHYAYLGYPVNWIQHNKWLVVGVIAALWIWWRNKERGGGGQPASEDGRSSS